MPHYADSLASLVREHKSPLVVGIDPRWDQLPDSLRQGDSLADRAEAYRRFSIGVIEAVAGVVPAVKPQAAFFEELGPAGMAALGDVIARARGNRLQVILDGKRNDIGSTAEAYARGMLGEASPWGADSVTVSPYLGDDSLAPFVTTAIERDAGLYVLVKTSNPGGALWQDKLIDGKPLYRHVGEHVEHLAEKTAGECGYGLVGAVVGATYPEQLSELRQAMPHTWFLVPGFGAQGGAAADVAGAFDASGLGAVVNSSRGVIFAYNRPEYAQFGQDRWQDAVQQAARDATAQLCDATPAGAL
ncbi:Orotidine 5'-phosphate decarboxylase [Posidoniimonas corsicana]|uniref:Orotidine 5'-phosphate decarboxylase n=1 Tax=Posidoniimonas corsicana TaxID=1938618 RepID=A0A5C5USG2_9BACT|nr:orotidine-5'-phosphate decarboxylase [Posidoniimonas corsicana]TWT29401.1 Orotidine 5'-phosphate decarboxylase [Posidoniimonas corsicana]